MAATTLNINVEIPNGKINMKQPKQQVTLYAQFTVNHIAHRQDTHTNSIKHFSELKGILNNNSGMTDRQLLDEY